MTKTQGDFFTVWGENKRSYVMSRVPVPSHEVRAARGPLCILRCYFVHTVSTCGSGGNTVLHIPIIPPLSLKRRSKSSLSGVHGDVAAQVAAGDEGFAAVRTPELLAVRVDRHVDLQGS